MTRGVSPQKATKPVAQLPGAHAHSRRPRDVRDGDTVLVHSMDRLARNLEALRRLVRELTGRGVLISFVTESITFTGEDNPMATLLLSVMGAFAEFERALIRERQRDGIALAKARGVYKGRKPARSPERRQELAARVAYGETIASLAREFGIARPTAYTHLAAAATKPSP